MAPSWNELEFAREARARAQSTRVAARQTAERAWQQRCAAVGLRIKARELGPPLQLQIPPDSSQLQNVRDLIRPYARARGADAGAVTLVAHEAIVRALTGSDPTTEPITLELGLRRGMLELRVQARTSAPPDDWHTGESPTARLIAALADHLDIRSLDGNTIEILAGFATSQP